MAYEQLIFIRLDLHRGMNLKLVNLHNRLELTEIPGLGELTTPESAEITGCHSPERLENLEKLENLGVHNCGSLVDVD